MSENLREQTFRAMKAAWRDRAMSVSFDVTWRAMTDAAWSVVGPELDRLNARVYEAVSESQILRPRASIAEAERDVLRARLAKVERLADEADDLRSRGWPGLIGPSDLRAALASVPEPRDSEPASHPQFSAFMDRALANPETRAAYEAALERDSEPAPRPSTPPTRTADGRTHITVHRSCNGSGRDLGDANDDELNAAVAGHTLPDVRRECGCDDSEPAPCGHVERVTGCGGCDPGAVEWVRDDGATHWRRPTADETTLPGVPAPDADREAGEWDGDDLPTPDEAERMGWTV